MTRLARTLLVVVGEHAVVYEQGSVTCLLYRTFGRSCVARVDELPSGARFADDLFRLYRRSVFEFDSLSFV
jgi:hypothetical protein